MADSCAVNTDVESPGKRARTDAAVDGSVVSGLQHPRRPARIAVVGAGSWSQGWHLPQLACNPEAEIAAIVEPADLTWSAYNPRMRLAKELAEFYRVPLFRDIVDLLQSESAQSLDGVIVATSHSSHYDVGMKALKAGLHVMMEKPMTADVQQAQELTKASASSGKILMVNNSANFRPQAFRAQELVRAGKVGEIEHVSCFMIRERAFFDHPENTAWCRPCGSMVGNGFAWGQLSHTLAWVFMVTGLCPASVFCRMVYSKKSGADLYDSASIGCTNGASIAVQGIASMPGAALKSGKLIENKIFGTDGCLFYSGDDVDPTSGNLVLMRHDGENETCPLGFHFENTAQEGTGPESLQAFIQACLGQPIRNAADAEIGLKVVQTIDAMYRSAKSGLAETISMTVAS
ncbi:unnamed protein product [Polarella glacialis]|uniref:Gfo/Idh/MocA-like oxidoreductase N-terminal domain-containing protein n=2 Tax=Polarella glacialis TaxID=89957 RepID=A0A813IPT4_POLGL|nr:unnamed protein product [Polarella glacialis]CAE8653280.1 unnamed protein product [Polarella glacialis]